MDKDFLAYYRSNLTYIRSLAGEFAGEFPKIASRLDINGTQVRDPFVERLLEGTAFLAARIEKKLDDGFPRLLESLLNSLAPRLLACQPSMAILKVSPKWQAARLPAGSAFVCRNDNANVSCQYVTMWSTLMSKLSVATCLYSTRPQEQLAEELAAFLKAEASLTLELDSQAGSIGDAVPDDLDLFLRMECTDASELLRQLSVDLIGVFAVPQSGKAVKLENVKIVIPALNHGEEFLRGPGVKDLEGLNVLNAVMAYPDLIKFVRLSGLKRQISAVGGNRAKIVFLFKRKVQRLSYLIGTESVCLGCVPIINLFRKRTSRSFIGDKYEIGLVVDRASPKEYEIWSTEKVEVFDDLNRTLLTAYPFHTVNLSLSEEFNQNFFNVQRSRKLFNNSSRTSGTSYRPTISSVTLSGEQWKDLRGRATQLAAEVWCTNGELPLFLRAGSSVSPRNIKDVQGCELFSSPSAPLEPAVDSGDKDSWRRLGYVLLNLSTFLDGRGGVPTTLVKRLVSEWGSRNEEDRKKLAEGILDIKATARMFRFVEEGAVYYENGYSVTLELIAEKFEGIGAFAFGCLLKRVMETFTPINSAVEVTLRTTTEGEIAVWKMQEN